jgi:hypothetical protein
MSAVAVCPHCGSYLTLPGAAGPLSQFACPACDEQFSFEEAPPKILPSARIVPTRVEVKPEPTDAGENPPEFSEAAQTALRRAIHEAAKPDEPPTILPKSSAAALSSPSMSRLDELLAGLSTLRAKPAEPLADRQSVLESAKDHASEDLAPLREPASEGGQAQAAPKAVQIEPDPGRFFDGLLGKGSPTIAPAEEAHPTEVAEAEDAFATERFEEAIEEARRTAAKSYEEIRSSLESPLNDGVELRRTFAPNDDGDEVRDEFSASDDIDEAGDPKDGSSRDFAVDDVYGEDSSAREVASVVEASPRVRKRSPLRTGMLALSSSALGILAGCYGLLCLRGPDADLLGMSRWLPASLLPASVRAVAASADASDVAVMTPAFEPPVAASADNLAEQPAVDPAPPAIRYDSSVAPASVVDPFDGPPAAAPTNLAAAPQPDDQRLYEHPRAQESGAQTQSTETAEALNQSLADSAPALRQLLEADLSSPNSFAELGQAYIQVCALAEQFTLSGGPSSSAEGERVRDALERLAAATERHADLGTIGARWLQHGGRQNRGAVLVGEVVDRREAGTFSLLRLSLRAGGEVVETAVVCDKSNAAPGEQLLVAGVIVDRQDPSAANLFAQLPADLTQAVVAGAVIEAGGP